MVWEAKVGKKWVPLFFLIVAWVIWFWRNVKGFKKQTHVSRSVLDNIQSKTIVWIKNKAVGCTFTFQDWVSRPTDCARSSRGTSPTVQWTAPKLYEFRNYQSIRGTLGVLIAQLLARPSLEMEGGWKQDIVKEVKKQLCLSGPLIAVGLFQYSLQLISITFVGHHGELALSAAALATSFASVTGFTLMMGVGTTLDTLCGQSFGAEQYHMLGVYSQRAMLVVSIINIFLSIIWANTKDILIAVHQDAAISREAGQYILFMIPSLFAYGLLQCLIKFFQTQNRVSGLMVLSGITSSFHAILCWSLVFKSALSIRGAALAISISYWVNVMMLALYIKFSSSFTNTWTGFSREAVHDIFSFIRISIPSALMLCLKVWSFEVMIFLSGLLPNPKLETSVLAVCFNTAQVVWVIPFGLSAAVSTRVSNELGAGRPKAARVAANVAIFMAIAEGLIVAIIIVLLRNILGHIFSNEKGVIKSVETMMPIVAASSFLDGIQSILSGIARGCGWQKIGAWINLGSYYLVGVPVAAVFAFVLHLKAKGLWLGILAAFSVQILLFLIIMIRANWEKQANKAARRVDASNIPVAAVSQG